MAKYPRPRAGEWVQPRMRSYKLACCDCGLVHLMKFRVIEAKTGRIVTGAKIQFRAWRDNRATAAVRRWK